MLGPIPMMVLASALTPACCVEQALYGMLRLALAKLISLRDAVKAPFGTPQAALVFLQPRLKVVALRTSTQTAW
jgi:hypothetical protein